MARFTQNDGRYTLTLDVNEIGTNVANNTSTLSWVLTLSSNGSYNFYQHTVTRNVYIDGSHVSYLANQTGMGKGGSITLSSGNAVVSHDSDGSKTVSVSASISTSGGAYYLPSPLSVSGSMTLTKIPRASTATVSNSTPTFGEQVTITITPATSGVTHDLWVGADGHISWTKIASNVDRAYTWTVPKSFAQSYTGTDNALWLKVDTYRGSTKLGDRVYYSAFRLQPDGSLLPDGVLKDSDTNEKSLSTGTYLKGYSEIKLTASGRAKDGATLKSTEIFLDGRSYTEPVVPQKSGQIEAKAVFKDSRNATRGVTRFIDVYDYKPPVLEKVKIRQNKTSIVVNVKGRVDSIRGNNTKKLTVRYKSMDEEYFNERNVTLYSWDFDIEHTITGLDTSKTYQIAVELEDKVLSTVMTTSTGKPVISRLAGGKGVTLFKEAEEEGFWVGNIDYTITDDEFARLMTLLK